MTKKRTCRKIILLDFDNTLINQNRSEAFQVLVNAFAWHPSKHLANKLFEEDKRNCSAEIYDRTFLFQLYARHFKVADPLFLCRQFWEQVRILQKPIEVDCEKQLAALAGEYRLVCTTDTDGPGSNKEARIWASGLHNYFERIFVGSENGFSRKGTAAYIQHILHELGVGSEEKSNCIMVGDKVGSDIIPAYEAGLSTILFVPPEPVCSGMWPQQIESLKQLPEQVHKLNKGLFPKPQVLKHAAHAWKNMQEAKKDNESRELILVGHTFSIVGEAGQIYRGYTNGDWGIDGEIVFKDDNGCASGHRLYMQLKSGDSYLRKRKSDGAEIFRIKNLRWADYWQQQAYSVMLVIRTSDGDIRWMDVSTYLKRECAEGKTVKRIVFEGERFDVMSVRRWRDKLLNQTKTNNSFTTFGDDRQC